MKRKPTPTERDITRKSKRLEKLIAAMPDFLTPDLHGVNGLDDLIKRVETELDQRSEWTDNQRHAVLGYLDSLRMAATL